MIDVFIGTKAQYIKTAPLLRLFQERGVAYRLIDSGQHAETAKAFREFLGVKQPDFLLSEHGNVATVGQAARWIFRNLWLTVFRPGVLRDMIFAPESAICVIHGDTPSTLLGLIMAKRVGKKVAHLEAGLRSFNILRPFPEELIRIICMRWSDLLFAPSNWAENNLKKMRVKGRIVNIGQNTNIEALHYALERADRSLVPARRFAVVTFHRVETILRRRRVRFMLDLIRRVAEQLDVIFVQHDPTERKLANFNLLNELNSQSRLMRIKLQSHPSFVALLASADFVITDGGSIQEECAALGKPCLVMRCESERLDGLDSVARLSSFDWPTVERFLAEYPQIAQEARIPNNRPSERIFSVLEDADFLTAE